MRSTRQVPTRSAASAAPAANAVADTTVRMRCMPGSCRWNRNESRGPRDSLRFHRQEPGMHRIRTVVSATALAAGAAEAADLVGTWRVERIVDTDADGKAHYPY